MYTQLHDVLIEAFATQNINPPIALAIDFIATWLTQVGYLWMKIAQISKEDAPI